MSKLTDRHASTLLHDWEQFWARPKQIAPQGDWRIWLILAGRGFGKTRTGAEWVRASARKYPLVNVIAPTSDDARDVMIEGESGILAVCSPQERPNYAVSRRRLEWPNGARTLIFTADEPERLRGKQHMRLWADELAAWRYPEAWDQALLGLRLGDNPRAVVTTTPKPIGVIKQLMSDETVVVTRGSSYENRANLAPAFFEQIISRYEGTRMGRQELMAELLDDVEGALWSLSLLDANRVQEAPEMTRVVIAVDPSGGDGAGNAECGIVAAGRAANGHAYVLADVSERLSPDRWARRAVDLYHELKADKIVAEKNFGGQMVEYTIKTIDSMVPVRMVDASRGKRARAEPIAALDEQGKVHHVGSLAKLEDQMTTWVPDSGDPSPDRMDARVWALSDLMLKNYSVEFY